MRHERECIGDRRPAELVREVGAERLGALRDEAHGPHALPAGVPPQRAGQRHAEDRGAGVGRTREAPQRGHEQELEPDHDRERIARQPDHDAPVAQPAPGRPARLHRDAPEQLLDAERAERGLDVVALADRDAARGDDDVGCRERTLERRACRLGIVADALDGDDLRARRLAAGGDQDAVGLVDLTAQERLAGRDELVARDDDVHARTPVAPELGDAAGRDRRQCERPQHAARGDHDRPHREIGALPPHVVADGDRRAERDALAVHLRQLDGHDGIGAGGQRRAGRHRHRRVRLELHGVIARERSPGHRELVAGVLGAHGEAVHRGVVEGRQIVRGMHVAGEHPPRERTRERQRLGRER